MFEIFLLSINFYTSCILFLFFQVKSYKKGKVNQLKVFTNKVMKLLDGKANASHIQALIKDKLDEWLVWTVK